MVSQVIFPHTANEACFFATIGSKNISLFLKKERGSGEGKNFFSRKKKFFPSPEIIIIFQMKCLQDF